MTTVKFAQKQNGIYNEKGLQVNGSMAANLEGLNPKELLEASIGLCTSITFTKILERDGLYREDMDFEVHVASRKHETANRFVHFEVQVKFPPFLEDAYIEKITPQIERGCTISNTVKNGAEIEIVKI